MSCTLCQWGWKGASNMCFCLISYVVQHVDCVSTLLMLMPFPSSSHLQSGQERLQMGHRAITTHMFLTDRLPTGKSDAEGGRF
jgi:hypothetical protein